MPEHGRSSGMCPFQSELGLVFALQLAIGSVTLSDLHGDLRLP